MLNCFIFIDYDSLRDVWKKPQNNQKKTDRIDNIDKEKHMKLTACIRVMISYVRKYSCTAFEKSIQIYCTITIHIICKIKFKKT